MDEGKMPTWLRRGLAYIAVATVSSLVTMMLCAGGDGTQSKLEQLESLINDCFVGQVDTTALRDGAAAGMVAATGDRWSYYIPAAQYATYQQQKANAYVGIGVTVSTKDTSGGLPITKIEPTGGAKDAGILPGDVIVAVDDKTLEDVGGDNLAQYISGKAGTTVDITVMRGGEKMTFTVERRTIQVQVAKGQLLDGNVGYIKIANFDERCAEETIALIEELIEQGAQSLLFDVRFNPGGYKAELVKVLDYLLPEGEVFHTAEYDGTEVVDTSDAKCLQMPMAVLVNGDSYSAAEFFAAALHEYEWATVVGQQTSGKGYYQYTMKLNDGSAVALSMGKYFTPKGVSLAEVGGLTPDIVVEVDEETASAIYGELLQIEEDPQVLAALEALNP